MLFEDQATRNCNRTNPQWQLCINTQALLKNIQCSVFPDTKEKAVWIHLVPTRVTDFKWSLCFITANTSSGGKRQCAEIFTRGMETRERSPSNILYPTSP